LACAKFQKFADNPTARPGVAPKAHPLVRKVSRAHVFSYWAVSVSRIDDSDWPVSGKNQWWLIAKTRHAIA